MQIWDTAGQERFRALGAAFYRGADACVLVFDVTNLDSFEHLPGWLEDFLEKGDIADPARYPFVIVGNKIDRESERVVNKQMGREMAGWLRDICTGDARPRDKEDMASLDRPETNENETGTLDLDPEPPLAATSTGRRRSNSATHSRKKSRGSDSIDSQRSFAIAADTVSSAVQSVQSWLRGSSGAPLPSNPKPIAAGSSGRLSPGVRSETSFSEASFRTAGSAFGSPDEDSNLLEQKITGRARSLVSSERPESASNLSPGWIRDPSPVSPVYRRGTGSFSANSTDGLLADDRAIPVSTPVDRRASIAGGSPVLSSQTVDDKPPLPASERPRGRTKMTKDRSFRPEIAYFESSAMTGAHVEDAFAYLARAVKLPVFAFEVGDDDRVDLLDSQRKGRRRNQRNQNSGCSC